MKKTAILLLPILLLAVSTSAVDLDAYPIPFISGGSFTAQIIVGAAAPSTDVLAASDIAVSLQQLSNTKISAQLDDEFDERKNGILIGLPCHNTALAKVLGTKECDIGLANGTGYLKLVEKDGQTFLIVTGKTPADTRKAARLLAQPNAHGLSGTEVTVTGTLDKPQAGEAVQPLQPPKTAAASAAASACVTGNDCPDDKWCLAGQCTALGCPSGTKAQSHDCVPEAKSATTAVEKDAEAKAAAAQPESKPAEKPMADAAEKKPGFLTRIISFFRNILR